MRARSKPLIQGFGALFSAQLQSVYSNQVNQVNQVNQGETMQVNEEVAKKIQYVELVLSDYLFDTMMANDPLIDAHVTIVSVMRDLKIDFLEVGFKQVNQGVSHV